MGVYMSAMKRVLGLLLLLAAPAAADEVVLRNGSVFRGLVVEAGDRVSVEMDYGTMSFRKVDVREIRRTDDPLKDLEKKVETAQTPKQIFEAALWARDKGLIGKSNELCEKILLLEPNHEGARKALGYERHEAQWLRGDDLMVARGFVRHEGKWLRRETAERLLAQESIEAIEFERQQTVRRAAEADREIELEKIALERERIEAERERDRRNPWWRGGFGPLGPSVIILPGACGPSAHPGYGPGRTLPPAVDRTYPSWTSPVLTPPATTTRGGPPLTTSK
jgi:hypothetical protein